MEQIFDVAIIGGGINGCGCAADAALRGLSVILFEKDDLASKTSSSSTKLIHGGLRYLEYYEFNLVKKALEERQTLLNVAPHLVYPQPFVLPYQKEMRAALSIRLGLFLYDNLSRKNKLPRCKAVNRKQSTYFDPLNEEFNRGFLFYDAGTDDARLTITNALQAKKHGAQIRTREQVVKAEKVKGQWLLEIKSQEGSTYKIKTRALINATGPWVENTAKLLGTSLKQKITLVKGSHLVVPKLYEGNHAYLLQHQDKRVIFVIPFHQQSMIGTTEVPFTTSLDEITIEDDEIKYLLTLVNAHFKKQLLAKDILYSWSGIRPLIAAKNTSASALSRDYSFEISHDQALLITLLGGKITTYRQLAEEVIDQLIIDKPKLSKSKTKSTPLPGALLNSMNFDEYVSYAKSKYHWLNWKILNRYLHSYGTNTETFLNPCKNMESMGKKFGSELYQVEIDYLYKYEWARTIDDVLLRRTKLNLSMDNPTKEKLAQYLNRLVSPAITAE